MRCQQVAKWGLGQVYLNREYVSYLCQAFKLKNQGRAERGPKILVYIYQTALRATPPPCLDLYVVIALWLGCVSCVWCYDVVVW